MALLPEFSYTWMFMLLPEPIIPSIGELGGLLGFTVTMTLSGCFLHQYHLLQSLEKLKFLWIVYLVH